MEHLFATWTIFIVRADFLSYTAVTLYLI
jgi:hypothetical protein